MKARTSVRILNTIFFLSGASALTYQVCWQRVLGLYYGVGPISTAIVVSVFMFGLGIGALAAQPLSSRFSSPIRLYIAIEALIAIFGFASLPLIINVGKLTAGSDYSLMLLYITLLLFIPTALMGATLPIVVEILLKYNKSMLLSVSSYYFVNTIGAAFGALFCSYILISFMGLDGAVYAAVATNAILAVAVSLLARKTPLAHTIAPMAPDPGHGCSAPPHATCKIAALLFINGFLAIGYQIIWYRIIGVILKDSAYSFSTTLAVYLLGIGVGSILLNRRRELDKKYDLLSVYLWINAATGVTSAVTVASTYFIFHFGGLAYGQEYDVLPFLGNLHEPHNIFRLISTLAYCVLWPLFLVFLPTVCMGAAFPLGIAMLAQRKGAAGSPVSSGYAITIAGNTVGGIATSFSLLPSFGTMTVLSVFAVLQTSIVLLMKRQTASTARLDRFRWTPLLVCVTAVACIPVTEGFYRALHPKMSVQSAFFGEGLEGVDLAYQQGNVLRHWINGSSHGGRPGYLFVKEALVALSYTPEPKRVLAIGFGTGKLVNTIQLDTRVQSITIPEINHTAVSNLMKISEINQEIEDPRIEFVFDDGRRFLERSKEKWDLIAIDPLRTRSAFSNNLYSVEFFNLVKNHLTDRGAFLVWTDDSTGIIAKTLATAFEYTDQYPYFFVASRSRLPPLSEVYSTLLQKLDPVSAAEVQKLESPIVRDRQSILGATVDVPINRDLKPNLEYFLWQAWSGPSSPK